MIPLEDFFRSPARAMLRLSPDGTHLAWLAPWESRLNLFVRELATGTERRLTSATERDLGGFLWADDRSLLYVRDSGGDENYRLWSVGRDGSEPVDLTPFEGVKCALVDDLPDVDGEVLFQMNRRDPRCFDVYRLDVTSGEMTLEAENPGNVQAWITDHAGRLRLATTSDGVESAILYRERPDDDWREVARYSFKEGVVPHLFTPDDREIYASSNVGRDRYAVVRMDPATGDERELLFEHDAVDVTQTVYSRARKRLTAAIVETDRMHYHFFDEQREALQRFLDEALPGRENRVVSWSRDESIGVVISGGDRDRGSYYLLDVEGRELTRLFEVAPWLDAEALAAMEPIELRARDGLRLHGYLTRPRVGDGPWPLVVNPHGGPWHRDRWGFNPEVQFLADRGFAVLQVNFRGSTGYGRAFWEAGFGQWGLAMQDDVSDAVAWAVEQGIADARRVAIYGGSYGGYSALSGMTRTPELYACGVSYVGVSNLFTWIESIPPYWELYLEMLYELVGHPERDAERFRATSPLFHVDRVRAPLFIAQGANDPRVPQRESDQIVEALQARGVPVTYLVKDNEGHGFHNEENRFEFYRALESFLGEHLGTAAAAGA